MASNTKENDDQSSPVVASNDSEVLDRGRSLVRRNSSQLTECNMRKKGYHTFMSSFGKAFHVEKRWKLVREMGSGAYGVVVSATDQISGETVAIKLVTRIFEKLQLAKRALREITLLRHFSNHENITGLIDMDAIYPDFQEIYIFMEDSTADLHQIIKSGQTLTNEHVQYFLYQVLRGMKYIHSASVIHRDLKPGNLLVNSDCELKICDFGLSRGFDSTPDEHIGSQLTEYVATRWYRAPEIMLSFRRYTTAIDVWSIGCIFAELLLGRPLFKGKDYVDQLNKIFDVLGTPEESVIQRIGSEKAQIYVRTLPVTESVPFSRLLPAADYQALDLLQRMLSFDPLSRITVREALSHPWLSTYHDDSDEPECANKFEKWKDIEKLETLEEFREAIWNEIQDYRLDVRGLKEEEAPLPPVSEESSQSSGKGSPAGSTLKEPTGREETGKISDSGSLPLVGSPERIEEGPETAVSTVVPRMGPTPTPTDPLVTYARRSSIIQLPRQPSTYNSPPASTSQQPWPSSIDGLPTNSNAVPFPGQTYVVPARSRAPSTAADIGARQLLRTLSTVSIHESAEGLPGGLAAVAPIGKYIVARTSGADAPPSEIPRDFGVEESKKDEGH
ncbi:kinase-like protein [Pisolithus croceorrhizus]|nr:kinase-like protein [Pisolithus croceorrhizus]KAI6144523.1 kinase-like protein [Pisolithus thermaeus]